jgi:hypothetical protein
LSSYDKRSVLRELKGLKAAIGMGVVGPIRDERLVAEARLFECRSRLPAAASAAAS